MDRRSNATKRSFILSCHKRDAYVCSYNQLHTECSAIKSAILGVFIQSVITHFVGFANLAYGKLAIVYGDVTGAYVRAGQKVHERSCDLQSTTSTRNSNSDSDIFFSWISFHFMHFKKRDFKKNASMDLGQDVNLASKQDLCHWLFSFAKSAPQISSVMCFPK